jgi:hypothetical protein
MKIGDIIRFTNNFKKKANFLYDENGSDYELAERLFRMDLYV